MNPSFIAHVDDVVLSDSKRRHASGTAVNPNVFLPRCSCGIEDSVTFWDGEAYEVQARQRDSSEPKGF